MTASEASGPLSSVPGSMSPLNVDDTTKADGIETKPIITLTEKEMAHFQTAMLYCLKSGAPEVDMHKFHTLGGFNTFKTAQNTWGKIKNKMFTKPDGTETTDAPKTPKKAATPRKRSAKALENDDTEAGADKEASESPNKKKARKSPATAKKTPAKKTVAVKVEGGEGEGDAEAEAEVAETPKKKRKSPVKKAVKKVVAKADESVDVEAGEDADATGEEDADAAAATAAVAEVNVKAEDETEA